MSNVGWTDYFPNLHVEVMVTWSSDHAPTVGGSRLKEIKKLQVDEFMKWKQRTKEHWLKHGDRNSKYFHACVNHRRRSNRISSVNAEDGSLCTTEY
jgi:hypothetical protein